jgi:hypothetical protein
MLSPDELNSKKIYFRFRRWRREAVSRFLFPAFDPSADFSRLHRGEIFHSGAVERPLAGAFGEAAPADLGRLRGGEIFHSCAVPAGAFGDASQYLPRTCAGRLFAHPRHSGNVSITTHQVPKLAEKDCRIRFSCTKYLFLARNLSSADPLWCFY